LGRFLRAGAFLAVGSCVSVLAKNQVIAFVIACAACFLFTVSGSPIVIGALSGWAPQAVIEAAQGFSFLSHFQAIQRGVIDLRDVIFFVSVMVVFLFANAVLLDLNKAR